MGKYVLALATSILLICVTISVIAYNLWWVDKPLYAEGEASAMVEQTCGWRENSADYYSKLYGEYLGDGVWEVKSSYMYNGEQAIFRVYEHSGTVQVVNTTAQEVLGRHSQLE